MEILTAAAKKDPIKLSPTLTVHLQTKLFIFWILIIHKNCKQEKFNVYVVHSVYASIVLFCLNFLSTFVLFVLLTFFILSMATNL
jgi:hypothetical protein